MPRSKSGSSWGIYDPNKQGPPDNGLVWTVDGVTVEAEPYVVEMVWAVVQTRLEPVKVCVRRLYGYGPVGVRVLNRLNLGRLQQKWRMELSQRRDIRGWEPSSREQDVFDQLAEMEGRGGHRGSPTKWSELQATADLYRNAHKNGRSKTKAVAEFFYLSESAAAKRIMKARRAHLLDDINRTGR